MAETLTKSLPTHSFLVLCLIFATAGISAATIRSPDRTIDTISTKTPRPVRPSKIGEREFNALEALINTYSKRKDEMSPEEKELHSHKITSAFGSYVASLARSGEYIGTLAKSTGLGQNQVATLLKANPYTLYVLLFLGSDESKKSPDLSADLRTIAQHGAPLLDAKKSLSNRIYFGTLISPVIGSDCQAKDFRVQYAEELQKGRSLANASANAARAVSTQNASVAEIDSIKERVAKCGEVF